MRRRAFTWSTRLIGAGLGTWVATLLLPGLRLTGDPARAALTVLVAAVLVVVATVAVPTPVHALMRRVRVRTEQRFLDDDYEYVDPMYWLWLIQFAESLLRFAVWAVLAATAVWLTALTGLGLTVAGVGTAVVAALVIAATWPLVRWPFQPRRRLVLEVATLVLTAGALLLALALLDGVRLEPGPGRLQLLVVAVLALVYHLAWFDLSIPFLTLVLRVTMAGLKLWLLSWLSGWLETPLRIEGFWSFVLAALIMVVLTWPLRLAQQVRPAYDPGLDALHHLELHQQMMWQRPLY